MPPILIDLSAEDETSLDQSRRPSKRPRRDAGQDTLCYASTRDVVIVEQLTGSKKKGRNASSVVLQEEEVLVVGEAGQFANKDFPHLRCDCGVHPFSQSACRANKKFCPQCYCFVCDTPVKECRHWGKGSNVDDHCNAFSNAEWDSLRRGTRKRKREENSPAPRQVQRERTRRHQPRPCSSTEAVTTRPFHMFHEVNSRGGPGHTHSVSHSPRPSSPSPLLELLLRLRGGPTPSAAPSPSDAPLAYQAGPPQGHRKAHDSSTVQRPPADLCGRAPNQNWSKDSGYYMAPAVPRDSYTPHPTLAYGIQPPYHGPALSQVPFPTDEKCYSPEYEDPYGCYSPDYTEDEDPHDYTPPENGGREDLYDCYSPEYLGDEPPYDCYGPGYTEDEPPYDCYGPGYTEDEEPYDCYGPGYTESPPDDDAPYDCYSPEFCEPPPQDPGYSYGYGRRTTPSAGWEEEYPPHIYGPSHRPAGMEQYGPPAYHNAPPPPPGPRDHRKCHSPRGYNAEDRRYRSENPGACYPPGPPAYGNRYRRHCRDY